MEPTPSHANSLKTRRVSPVGCTLCWADFCLKETMLLHWFIIYQGFSVATSIDPDGEVPSGVDDGIIVGWDEIGVGGMPRI